MAGRAERTRTAGEGLPEAGLHRRRRGGGGWRRRSSSNLCLCIARRQLIVKWASTWDFTRA